MAGTFTPIVGDDVDDIIDENGGSGDWEDHPEQDTVDRWQFPRFTGATDTGDMYLSRVGLGPYDTDVEMLVGWLSAPRNVVGGVMALGDPGCGKTALIEAAATHAEATLFTHVCTPDDTRDSLYLRFVGEGNGEHGTPFVKGVIPAAVEHAKTALTWLYLDEATLLADGVKPAAMYPLADGRKFLPGGNVDGSDLEIPETLRLVISANPQVRGSSIPEPIASRFSSTTITVETSASLLRDLALDDSVVEAWEALRSAGGWYPQIREVRLADYWLNVDPSQAVSAFLPEHCPESQREQVKNIVVSFLGGDLRKDGRLVVR